MLVQVVWFSGSSSVGIVMSMPFVMKIEIVQLLASISPIFSVLYDNHLIDTTDHGLHLNLHDF